MVKIYASLLALTLATSMALAAPHPSYSHGLNYYDRDLPVLERDLDYLEAREFRFFDQIKEVASQSLKGTREFFKKGFLKAKAAVRGADSENRANHGTHNSGHRTAQHTGRHHRRDFEDDEELLRRDLDDAEELFGREYDDFLAERDFFDDLD